MIRFVAIFVVFWLASAANAERVILPKLKPFSLAKAPQTDVQAAAPHQLVPVAFPPDMGSWPKSIVMQARQACAAKLKALDLTYETLPPMGKPNGCGSAAPLLISEVADVRIVPPMESTCTLAESLHHWVAWAVKPAAAKHLGKNLAVINNASAYACRRRNNSASGKLSEHAFANALDIATLQFDDGSRITIKGDWSGLKGAIGASAKAAFLKTIRTYACLRFTTVLGPGSDKYHGDHFHVDVAQRRNGYRICK